MADSTLNRAPVEEMRRVTIRLPMALHEALLTHREQSGKSLNDILIEAIAKLVGCAFLNSKRAFQGRNRRRKKCRRLAVVEACYSLNSSSGSYFSTMSSRNSGLRWRTRFRASLSFSSRILYGRKRQTE